MTGGVFSRRLPPKAAKKPPLPSDDGKRPNPTDLAAVAAEVPRAPKGKIGSLIWHYLRGIFPREETPKTIAAAIREKASTVRKELLRLEESGHVINRNGAGWYRAWADPALLKFAERPEPCVHGLQIRAAVPLAGGSGVPRGARQAVLSGATAHGWTVDERNGQTSRLERVLGYPVRFTASATGTLTIDVSASAGPIHYRDWPVFVAELRGLCRGYGVDLDAPTSQLVNIEFNADWRQFFLGGLKRVKLSNVSRAWGQLYQKWDMGLRMEVRHSPKELTFREAAEIIVSLVEAEPRPLREPAVPAAGGVESQDSDFGGMYQ